jgi:hypothetical protein
MEGLLSEAPTSHACALDPGVGRVSDTETRTEPQAANQQVGGPQRRGGWSIKTLLARWGIALLAVVILVVGLVVSNARVRAANDDRDAAIEAVRQSAQDEIATAQDEAARATGRLATVEESNENLGDQLEEASAEIARLKKQVDTLQDKVKKAEAAAAPPQPKPAAPAGNSCPSGHMCYTITSTGSSSVDVTYTNKSGGTSQAIGASLPWFLDLGANAYFNIDFFYVSGQQMGSGTVTCTIWDGKSVYAKGSSTGQYSICTASD